MSCKELQAMTPAERRAYEQGYKAGWISAQQKRA